MIAYDATSGDKSVGLTTSLTVSHTCTGSNGLLVVLTINSGNINSSGVTYNGVAMTNLYTSASGYDVWYLLSPATGAHNIVSSAASSYMILMATSYTGVAQSGFPDAGGNSVSVTPISNGTWAISAACRTTAGQITQTNFTQRQTSTGDNNFTNGCLGDTNGAVRGTQTFTFSVAPDAYTFSIVPNSYSGTGFIL